MYLFAPAAFVMKVTALHLWSIFTPKSGVNAKEREGRMHFGAAQRFAASIAGVKQTSLKLNAKEREKRMHFDVAQRFAALIAGVRQMSLELRAEASAGLPRSVRGYAGLQRGIASQCQGACRLVVQDCLAVSGGMQACGAGCSRNVGWFRTMYRAPRVHLLSGSWRTSRRLRFASKQRACRTSGQWQATA